MNNAAKNQTADNQTDDKNQTTENLTDDEKKTLFSYEAKIRNGLKAFYKVGEALAMIRQDRLYRADFSTFDKYASTKWDMTRQRVTQLVSSWRIMSILKADGFKILPVTESQCRPFNALPEDMDYDANVRGIWQAVVDSGEKITAKLVTTVTAEYLGLETPEQKADRKKAEKAEADSGHFQGEGESASAEQREMIRELKAKIAYLESALAAEKQAHKRTVEAAKGHAKPSSAMAQDLYKAGFRVLAKKHHPDHGGSVDSMKELNELKSALNI